LAACTVRCFGPNLHLAITKAIKDDPHVARALGMIRKLITHLSHSWNKKRDLMEVQTDLGIPNHSEMVMMQVITVLHVKQDSQNSLYATWCRSRTERF